jgi:glyoxylase-like metal-dependent hydrolase (beta-lactamase superfamily II)
VGGATAFPGSALVIASDACATALEDQEYDFSLEARLRAGDPEEWTAPERRLPSLRLTAYADLDDPLNSVRLIPIGPAQTTGDMLVMLPRENILFAGSLVSTDRNPFAADASAAGWLNALNRIAKMAPSLVLPARGAGVETRIVRERRDAIAWLRGQVEQEFHEKIHPVRMPERIVELPEATKYFDLEADPSFIAGLIERVVADAIEARRKRGTWTD